MSSFRLVDLYNKVYVPRLLVIENSRLGVLNRAFQGLFVSVAAYQIYYALFTPFFPRPEGWAIYSPSLDTSIFPPDAAHCHDMEEYKYIYSGTWSYQPGGCSDLHEGEAYKKGEGVIFIPTYFSDEMAYQRTGADCQRMLADDADEANPAGCLTSVTDGHTSRGSFKMGNDGVTCKCSEYIERFTKYAEKRKIEFTHGYEVATTSDGAEVQRGRSTDLTATMGPSNGDRTELSEDDSIILTVIESTDGQPCAVGDKTRLSSAGTELYSSKWTQEMSLEGISATLEDWLACAKDADGNAASLDYEADGLRSGNPDENKAPHLRITGLKLFLDLMYYNREQHRLDAETRAKHELADDFSGVLCVIRVRASFVWNSAQEMAYATFNDFRFRYQYGVTVRLQSLGVFKFPQNDVKTLSSAIVNAIVITKFPAKIMTGIALFGVGLLSKIYYATASEKVNINDEFHGVCARMMSNSASFRELTKQHDGRLVDGMTFDLLSEHMRVGFSKQLEDKTLTEKEIVKMTRLIMNGLDPSRDGEIDVGEFVATCASNEVLKIEDITQFFDENRKRSCLERLLDDTRVEHDDPDYDPQTLSLAARQARKSINAEKREADKNTSGGGMLDGLDRALAF
jgi:hypothetical protein